jgi:hypothetical protein
MDLIAQGYFHREIGDVHARDEVVDRLHHILFHDIDAEEGVDPHQSAKEASPRIFFGLPRR